MSNKKQSLQDFIKSKLCPECYAAQEVYINQLAKITAIREGIELRIIKGYSPSEIYTIIMEWAGGVLDSRQDAVFNNNSRFINGKPPAYHYCGVTGYVQEFKDNDKTEPLVITLNLTDKFTVATNEMSVDMKVKQISQLLGKTLTHEDYEKNSNYIALLAELDLHLVMHLLRAGYRPFQAYRMAKTYNDLPAMVLQDLMNGGFFDKRPKIATLNQPRKQYMLSTPVLPWASVIDWAGKYFNSIPELTDWQKVIVRSVTGENYMPNVPLGRDYGTNFSEARAARATMARVLGFNLLPPMPSKAIFEQQQGRELRGRFTGNEINEVYQEIMGEPYDRPREKTFLTNERRRQIITKAMEAGAKKADELAAKMKSEESKNTDSADWDALREWWRGDKKLREYFYNEFVKEQKTKTARTSHMADAMPYHIATAFGFGPEDLTKEIPAERWKGVTDILEQIGKGFGVSIEELTKDIPTEKWSSARAWWQDYEQHRKDLYSKFTDNALAEPRVFPVQARLMSLELLQKMAEEFFKNDTSTLLVGSDRFIGLVTDFAKFVINGSKPSQQLKGLETKQIIIDDVDLLNVPGGYIKLASAAAGEGKSLRQPGVQNMVADAPAPTKEERIAVFNELQDSLKEAKEHLQEINKIKEWGVGKWRFNAYLLTNEDRQSKCVKLHPADFMSTATFMDKYIAELEGDIVNLEQEINNFVL